MDDDPWSFCVMMHARPFAERARAANDLVQLAGLLKRTVREVPARSFLPFTPVLALPIL
jgi:hypothetical protein